MITGVMSVDEAYKVKKGDNTNESKRTSVDNVNLKDKDILRDDSTNKSLYEVIVEFLKGVIRKLRFMGPTYYNKESYKNNGRVLTKFNYYNKDKGKILYTIEDVEKHNGFEVFIKSNLMKEIMDIVKEMERNYSVRIFLVPSNDNFYHVSFEKLN